MRRRFMSLVAAVAAGLALVAPAYAGTFKTLYQFPAKSASLTNILYADGSLWVTTVDAVYQIDPVTGDATLVRRFGTANRLGTQLTGLTYDATNGRLYGLSSEGSTNNAGALFWIDATTFSAGLVYAFGANSTDAATPKGAPLVVGSHVYGSAISPSSGTGAIFSINRVTRTETWVESSISGLGQGWFYAGVVRGPDGINATAEGGDGGNACGGVFGVTPSTLGQTTMGFGNSFAAPCEPEGTPVWAFGLLWGTTIVGGGTSQDSYGSIYTADPKTGLTGATYGFSNGADGGQPQSNLILFGNSLFGTNTSGGANNGGVLFSYTPATRVETPLYSFAKSSNPGNVTASSTTIYGITTGDSEGGGEGGGEVNGMVYSYTP